MNLSAAWMLLACPSVLQLRYDIPKSYGFHRKASMDIEVDLWRFTVS